MKFSFLTRIFILIVLFCTLTFEGLAQELEWSISAGGTDDQYVRSIGVDGLGNVYNIGVFNGTADFDPGAGVSNLTSFGIGDIFIQKLDAGGNFIWVKQIGGTNNDYVSSAKVDAAGNLYLTGWLQGTCDFDPGTGTLNLTSAGSQDVFFCKLNNAGDLVWANKVGSTGADYGSSIAIDASGNVYIGGDFNGTVDFNPGAGTNNLGSAGSYDSFILKLDTDGNFVWAKRIGNSYLGFLNGIYVDALGNIYTTGQFIGTVDFDPGVGTYNIDVGFASNKVFVLKLNASGNFVWARNVGGPGSNTGRAVTVDASGNVIVAGIFDNNCDFDPGAAVFDLVSAGSNDVFIWKLDALGNFVWAKSFGGIAYDEMRSIALDPAGNIYTVGPFSETIDFDPGVGTCNYTSSGTDIYIQQLSPSGNLVWAKQIGAAGDDAALAINIDAAGVIYVGGSFQQTVDFDLGPLVYNMTALDVADAFTMKLSCHESSLENISACGSYTWKNGVTYTSSQASVTHTVPGVAAGGCDSVYVLYLTVTPSPIVLTALADFDVTCNGGADGSAAVNPASGGTGVYTYDWTPGTPSGDGTTSVTGLTAGNWSCTVTDENNCETTTSFVIDEPAEIINFISETACDSYTWNSQTYFLTGTYVQTLTSMNGCDSTVTLNLTLNNSTNGIDVIESCDSYTWIDGVTYTASNNTATHVLTNSTGCDSVVTLNLTINNSTNGIDVIESCDSYTWIDGITYTTSNNVATHVLTNTAGCDSVVTLNLTINNAPTMTASDNGSGTLTASSANSYQWIDCITNLEIVGATSASFSPTSNGTYAVIGYSPDFCADTSDCAVINYLSVDELNNIAWSIVPNPASDFVKIAFDFSQALLTIYDAQGRPVLQKMIEPGEQISMHDFESGVYFFELKSTEGKTVKRVMKV